MPSLPVPLPPDPTPAQQTGQQLSAIFKQLGLCHAGMLTNAVNLVGKDPQHEADFWAATGMNGVALLTLFGKARDFLKVIAPELVTDTIANAGSHASPQSDGSVVYTP